MPEPREILGEFLFNLICQLSRRQDVPDVVVDDVFAIKKLADRVDGRIHANTICMVLISHGYSADDNKYGFERGEWKEDANTKHEASIENAITQVEPVAAIAKPKEDSPASVNGGVKVEDTEAVVETEIIDKTPDEDAPAPSPLSDIDEGPQPLADETEVTFIHEGGYVDGTIKSSQVTGEDIFYEIEVDGIDDPVTKHEDDVNIKK